MFSARALSALLLLLLSCSGRESKVANGSGGVKPATTEAPVIEDPTDDDPTGLRFSLSEGERAIEAGERAPLADASPLPKDRVDAILQRLPGIEAAERAEFALRAGSPPPPRSGTDIQQPWPPPKAPDVAPDVEIEELAIRRYAPEGDIPIARHLSITFNQPMVALTSQDRASQTVPVQLSPEVEGHWRWVGTDTLLFEPDPRLPMATHFTAVVPVGTASVRGSELTQEHRWTFSTPALQLESATPQGEGQALEPVLVWTFDQGIGDGFQDFVELRASGSPIPLRPATQEEIDAWPPAKRLIQATQEGRFLAMKPTTTLTPGTSYTMAVRSGAPSAEGPRVTKSEQTSSFRTYDPLTVQRWHCWERSDGCAPQGSFSVQLNNELDPEQDLDELVQFSPDLEGIRVEGSGRAITFRGAFPAKSRVQVTLSDQIKDVFGQPLHRGAQHTYRIGAHDPLLAGPGGFHIVLDPAGPAELPIYSRTFTSLQVSIYRISPTDLAKLGDYLSTYYEDEPPEPPLTRLDRRTIRVSGDDDLAYVESMLDLEPFLDNGVGQVFVDVRPRPQASDRWRRQHLRMWVQRTNLGLTGYLDQDQVLAWVTDLRTGEPVEGAKVRLNASGQGAATSDADGVARLGIYRARTQDQALIAEHQGDQAFLTPSNRRWGRHGSWVGTSNPERLSWFVFDDRGMVKPSEEAYIKGFVRPFLPKPGEGLRALPQDLDLRWKAVDSRGADIGEGTTKVQNNGGFDLTIPIPDTPNLGRARVTFSTTFEGRSQSYTHTFQIQEFRRPEYRVSTQIDPRPYVLGDHAIATVEAAYYAGGALPNASVTWNVSADLASYTPPGWRDFSFGPWSPWWRSTSGSSGQSQKQTLSSQTGSDGTHDVRIDLLGVKPTRPARVRAEATVEDVNRQRWSSSGSFLVHPATRYVGLKLARPFIQRGKEQEFQAIVTSIEGEAVSDVPLELVIERTTWSYRRGRYVEDVARVQTCELTSTSEPVSCAYTFDEGGSYRVTATLRDEAGRRNESTVRFWVSGGPSRPQRTVEREEVTLVPSAETYKVGDVAEILLQAPFAPAQALVTIHQDGVLRSERVELPDGATTLSIPIDERFVPNVGLVVEVNGSSERLDDDGTPIPGAEPRVAYASGSLTLKVPPLEQTLQVEVKPERQALSPGSATFADITVRHADGRAAEDAEVAVWMVDESVLALSGYTLPDPIEIFYRSRPDGVRRVHSRALVTLADPESLEAGAEPMAPSHPPMQRARSSRAAPTGAAPPPSPAAAAPLAESSAMDMDMERTEEPKPVEDPGGAIEVRTDFRAVAIFSPRVRTDAQGSARVQIELPDNLTSYRIFAVAADTEVGFGSGEHTVVARKPLMLRPSLPRFLNVGDRAELPFVVQNPSDEPITVELALQVDNGKVLGSVDDDVRQAPSEDRAGLRFTVPAEDRREVRLPVGVVDAGRFRWQAAIVGAGSSDAASDDLPIWTPATTEAFATYGTLTQGASAYPIEVPTEAWPQFGGLEISLSSTELHSLTDGMIYLNAYPYGCTEQIASRVLVNAAMRDVLQAFESPQLPPARELAAQVERDLEQIGRRQVSSGGFRYWSTERVYPYASLHATHAFVRARDKGWTVDQGVVSRALRYAQNIERHIPSWYSGRAKLTLRAYALYVRHRAGDTDRAKAEALFRVGLDRLPLEAQGWLVPVLHASGQDAAVRQTLRHWENNVAETAASAQFNESYTDHNDYVLMHGNRRTDGVLLESLLEVRPEHDLIVKVVRGLLGHRVAGRWSTTQENAFVLLAMDRYFRVYEGVTPDFVARTWIDGGFVAQAQFKGRSTERNHLDVPMSWLAEQEQRDLVLSHEGQGRLYYRLGLRYAPGDLQIDPASHGMTIERTYEAVDDPKDVVRDADGTWRVKAGARVRVRVTLVAPARRTLVAMMDPMPAGFEAMNPAIAITGSLPVDPNATPPGGRYWWWHRPWYSHQNLRDERAEAFADLLWPGVHEYVYTAVATTPGRFVVPPPKIEEMYHPETFGRGASERVIVY
ncbi:MAG: hypothetical protein EA397_01580 [Deltaproteobacteria bacterium]|nr:MAG: hypothetical protein EA397_01580 [Deltaproteobacteria bacterium]